MELENLEKKTDKNVEKLAKEDVKIDHLTELIGLFGPFQGAVYLIMGITISMHTWQMMGNKFFTYKTDYYCTRPENLQHLTIESWLNLSSPFTENGEFDHCQIFDIDYDSVAVRPEESTQTKLCTSWEYHNEYFQVRLFFAVFTTKYIRGLSAYRLHTANR